MVRGLVWDEQRGKIFVFRNLHTTIKSYINVFSCSRFRILNIWASTNSKINVMRDIHRLTVTYCSNLEQVLFWWANPFCSLPVQIYFLRSRKIFPMFMQPSSIYGFPWLINKSCSKLIKLDTRHHIYCPIWIKMYKSFKVWSKLNASLLNLDDPVRRVTASSTTNFNNRHAYKI